MINVEINGKLVGQCESAGKASSPLFKDVIEPWIEIRGFIASSPSLTADQQVVLEWLKKKIDSYLDVSYLVGDLNYFAATPVGQAWKRLSNAEQFQVLAAFAEWGMSND